MEYPVQPFINKEYGCMTSDNARSSAADSVKETDSYILLPEIEQLGKTMFAQKSVVAEINKTFMKICLTTGEVEPVPPKTSMFECAVETCFSELFTFCRNTVFKRCRNLPLSEDIAQESILCLLKEQNTIEQIKPWLFKVSINNMENHFRNQGKEDYLLRQLRVEIELLDSIESSLPMTEDQYTLLSNLPTLRQSPEYKAFKELTDCQDLQEYARIKEVTLNQAKKASVKIKHDLRSLYLRQSGWEAGLDILPYQKFMVLKRFVNSMTKIWDDESLKTMKKYSSEVSLEKMRIAFEGITKVDYWDLVYKGEDCYNVYVFFHNPSEGPLLTTVKLKFNAKNRIEVEGCGKNILAGVYKKPENYRLPLERGKLMYSFLELKSIFEKITEFNQ
jgi:DNA-directed RNA polymerase specialized sigma24 family protein